MKKSLVIMLLALASCTNQKSDGKQVDNGPPGPPQIHTDCTVWESGGSSLQLAQFVGHFAIPDRYFICGETTPFEQDYFWFASQNDVSLNFALNSNAVTVCKVTVWGRSLIQDGDDLIVVHDLLHSFLGAPGSLQVSGFRVPQTNYGFVVGVTSLNSLSDYQLEIWPF